MDKKAGAFFPPSKLLFKKPFDNSSFPNPVSWLPLEEKRGMSAIKRAMGWARHGVLLAYTWLKFDWK